MDGAEPDNAKSKGPGPSLAKAASSLKALCVWLGRSGRSRRLLELHDVTVTLIALPDDMSLWVILLSVRIVSF